MEFWNKSFEIPPKVGAPSSVHPLLQGVHPLLQGVHHVLQVSPIMYTALIEGLLPNAAGWSPLDSGYSPPAADCSILAADISRPINCTSQRHHKLRVAGQQNSSLSPRLWNIWHVLCLCGAVFIHWPTYNNMDNYRYNWIQSHIFRISNLPLSVTRCQKHKITTAKTFHKLDNQEIFVRSEKSRAFDALTSSQECFGATCQSSKL